MYLESHDIKQGLGKKQRWIIKEAQQTSQLCNFLNLLMSIFQCMFIASDFLLIPALAFQHSRLVNFEAEHLKQWESPLIIHLFYKMFAFWIIFSDIQSLLQLYERLNTSYAPLYNLNLLSRNGLQKCIKQIASVNQIESYIFRYKNVLNWPLKCPVISVPC